MTYDFSNVAILCTDWAQMEDLARIADEHGSIPALFNVESFNSGDCYFISSPNKMFYTCTSIVPHNYTSIPYTSFANTKK